jgi:hypothetical protein
MKNRRKKNNNAQGQKVGQFVKDGATKESAFHQAGGFTNLPPAWCSAPRVWLEWTPVPQADRKQRLALLTKADGEDRSALLPGALKVPVRGVSCCLKGRRLYTAGGGTITCWYHDAPANVREWVDLPGGVAAAPVTPRSGRDRDR